MVDIQTIKNYYNRTYYRNVAAVGRPTQHYDLYLRYLGLRLYKGRRFLDIACGTGKLGAMALKRGMRVSGIDISEKAITHAKSAYPLMDLKVGAAETLPWPDDSFDAVMCLGSLEHFVDMTAAVKEMMRVCKNDGRILVMVPNKDFPNWNGTQQAQVKETRLSLKEWTGFLSENGLSILKVRPDRWPIHWIPLPKLSPIRFVKALFQKYKLLRLPLWQSYQFIFTCVKKNVDSAAGSR